MPKQGDSDVVLLAKIVASLSASNAGAYPPRRDDSKNDLLFKWAQHLSIYGV
jgi:hypothetical protein